MSSPTALITGASGGIGSAIAEKLASEGCPVILVSHIHKEKTDALAAAITGRGGKALSLAADLSDAASCEALFLVAEAFCGGPDILVNCAGISRVGVFQELSEADWQQLLAVNVTSVYHTCRAVIPLMLRKGGGKILNISSVWGQAGASCEAAYSATKGAVDALSRALGKELAPSGIQVNALALGAVDTAMNAWLAPDERAALEEEIPAGRFASPKEAAEAAWSILSAGPYLTGQVIRVDGGWI